MSTSSTSKNEKRKNDDAWSRFFAATDTLSQIDAQGYCNISAAQLGALAGREPRLLAKQDTLHDRPEVFKKHNITIFPVKNGEYILFRDPDAKTYYRIDEEYLGLVPNTYESKVALKSYEAFPGLQRLNESQALDFAFISSLLRTFTRDTGINLVIRGRNFSGSFQFDLPHINHRVDVSSVQIEVDGGYESKEAIYLIEAKTGRRKDFNIRQLYYPYLEWTTRVAAGSRKRVVPIFFYITNGKFYFFEFRFNRAFGDLEVQRAEAYSINEPVIAKIDLAAVVGNTPDEGEPQDIPFPQADDLDKIVDLLAYLDNERGPEQADKMGIAEYFGFAPRQADYYANAAAYLGLLQRTEQGEGFDLTARGNLLVGTPSIVRRTEILVEQMARRPVFRDAFMLLQAHDQDLLKISSSDIEASIVQNTQLRGSTPARRASTVRGWLRWLKQNAALI
jgi:hypothetical protein